MNVVLWFIVIVVHSTFAVNKDQEGFSVTSGNNFYKNYTNHHNYYPPTGKVYSNVNGDYHNEETGSISITSTDVEETESPSITSTNVDDSVSNNKSNGEKYSTVRNEIKNNDPSTIDGHNQNYSANLGNLNRNSKDIVSTNLLSTVTPNSSLQLRNEFMTNTLANILDENTIEINSNTDVTTPKKDNVDQNRQNQVSKDTTESSSSQNTEYSSTNSSPPRSSADIYTTLDNKGDNHVGVKISEELENILNGNEKNETFSTTTPEDVFSPEAFTPASPDYSFSTPVSSTTNGNVEDETVSKINEDNLSIPTQKLVCLDLPGVEFITIEPLSFNVSLEWKVVNNTGCIIDSYTIYLNNQEYNETSLSRTIEGLYACTTYNISIAAIVESTTGPITEDTFTTIVPVTNFTGVQNLTANETSENDLSVSWDPPLEEVLQCVTSYYLIWWDRENGTTQELQIDASLNSYIMPLIGCMKYSIQVKPQAGVNDGNIEIVDYDAAPFPSNAPNIVVDYYGKTEASVTFKTDDWTKNKCEVTDIVVTCNAPTDTNFNASWIIWEADAVVAITEQNPNFTYSMDITNLSSFTNYTCKGLVKNTGGNSSTTIFPINTEEEVPSAPQSLNALNVTSNSFTLEWVQPDTIPGVMEFYGLHIDSGGPQQIPAGGCSNTTVMDLYFEVNASETTYVLEDAVPYYKYIISLYGMDGAGNGTVATQDVLTSSSAPDSIENPQVALPTYSQDETYHATVQVTFEPPCNFNGLLKHYEVVYTGVRNGFENDEHNITTNETTTELVLKAARNYSILITVVTENFASPPVTVPPVLSRPGVPTFVANMTTPSVDTTAACFKLPKSVFGDDNGDIIAYALFFFTKSGGTSGFGFWDGSDATWPAKPENATQLTPNLWNPFNAGAESVDFTIGNNPNCNGQNYWNQSLNPDTKYWLLVRALTSAAYKDSPLLDFQTEMLDGLNLALILGLTFGLLALLVLVVFLVFLWRRKRKTEQLPEEEKKVSITLSHESIPVQKYATYYASLKENYHIIKEQYTEIGLKSKDVAGETSFAVLPENKRKNRYTNILPYDETRVMLKIDEDDEISSDYINASYIRGYCGKIEYIATQGPLESTARDFWKMILQENVSIIAMVSQFVEQTKEKCYQYFPNNHESVYFGESLEVKCSTELHFGTYCVRTLQVRKGTEQRDVVHMQFLEWPDFGVPQGTDNMLQFCGQLREKINREGGLIAVHCSAGVGRTGTLIAMDILLQTIDDHRDINIYKTVFDLRKQRTNMVQTEKQYKFIHTCIKDYIETPSIPPDDVSEERIYENMDVIRSSSLKKNLIEIELESAL